MSDDGCAATRHARGEVVRKNGSNEEDRVPIGKGDMENISAGLANRASRPLDTTGPQAVSGGPANRGSNLLHITGRQEAEKRLVRR